MNKKAFEILMNGFVGIVGLVIGTTIIEETELYLMLPVMYILSFILITLPIYMAIALPDEKEVRR